jgi:hypothetical protein
MESLLLFCRALSSPTMCRFIPALSVPPGSQFVPERFVRRVWLVRPRKVRALRESNLRLLESVPRARWVEFYGVHKVRGRQTVEEFVRLEAAHDLNHLRQIDRILGGCMTGQS